ncbi:hypothetical protein [Paraburkholderia sp. ZP32-5]|uniref:hypothetical protein n=1 Tax=Paraburkholderia sp. ZP32-5 TaxID=2883245 RepID=UPI001F180226|nr:hypothetical protein [Paraburkholderia sp. ZP32-5]
MRRVIGGIAGGIARSALIAVVLTVGSIGGVDAQQLGTSQGAGGAQSGTGGAATTQGAGTGTSGSSALPGVGTSAGAKYGIGPAGSVGSGPALNNMRANGTALYMPADPRAPNVSGRAAPPR